MIKEKIINKDKLIAKLQSNLVDNIIINSESNGNVNILTLKEMIDNSKIVNKLIWSTYL